MTTSAAGSKDSTGSLYVAFELSSGTWKLAFTVGRGQRPRVKGIRAGDVKAVVREIRAAKKRFGLAEGCRVLSCYEAGRDGFWVHRFLTSIGVENLVVDSASIEVSRRRRRAKTDRLDAEKLVMMLVRWDEPPGATILGPDRPDPLLVEQADNSTGRCLPQYVSSTGLGTGQPDGLTYAAS